MTNVLQNGNRLGYVDGEYWRWWTDCDLTSVRRALLVSGTFDPAVTQCSEDELYMYKFARQVTLKLSPATTCIGDW